MKLSQSFLNEVVEEAKRKISPFKEFCERRYANLSGYNVKMLKYWLGSTALAFENSQGNEHQKINNFYEKYKDCGSLVSLQSNLVVTVGMLAFGCPIFAVERNFLTELINMEPTTDWNIQHEALMPYPYYALLFPQGVLKYNDTEVSMISIGGEIEFKNILMMNVHMANGSILHASMRVLDDGTVLYDHKRESFSPADNETETEIADDLNMLKFGFYLAMAITSALNSDFGVITSGKYPSVKSTNAKKDKGKDTMWYAPVISATSIKPGKCPRESNESDSHGRTLRKHRRRAHWHTVLYGPGRVNRKKMRFPAILVNAD